MNKVFYISTLLVVTLIICFVPVFSAFDFGSDEYGVVESARSLYHPQAPRLDTAGVNISVLDVINRSIFFVFGEKIWLLRLVTLAFFSVLLLTVPCLVGKNGVGRFVGVYFGWLALLVLPFILQLSVSAVKLIPAMALACAGLALVKTGTRSAGTAARCCLSGVLSGLAIQLDAISLLVVPAIMAMFLCAPKPVENHHSPRPLILNMAFWLLSVMLTTFAISLIQPHWSVYDLFDAHEVSMAYSEFTSDPKLVANVPLQAYWLFPLCIIGSLLCCKQANWRRLVPGIVMLMTAWLTSLYFGFLNSQLCVVGLIAVAFLAAPCAEAVWNHLILCLTTPDQSPRQWAGVSFSVGLMSVCFYLSGAGNSFNSRSQELHSFISLSDLEIINQMKKYAGQTHWIYSRDRICSFYSGLNIPPTVLKLLGPSASQPKDEELFSEVVKAAPEQLALLREVELKKQYWQDYLANNYTEVDSEFDMVLFVANKLHPTPVRHDEMLKKLGI